MIVKVKKRGKSVKSVPGDAGFYIFSNEDAVIEPFSQKLISTDLYLEKFLQDTSV